MCRWDYVITDQVLEVIGRYSLNSAQLVFAVEPIGEVYPSKTTVGVNCEALCLHIIGSVRPTSWSPTNWIRFDSIPRPNAKALCRWSCLTRVTDWKLEARNRRRICLSSIISTSKLKYFFIFLTIITRNGNLMPKLALGCGGHVMKVVDTLAPVISITRLWISLSVIRLIEPFLTFLSHICNGFEPMLYSTDRKPLWNVFLNIGWLVSWWSKTRLSHSIDSIRYRCQLTSGTQLTSDSAKQSFVYILAKHCFYGYC